MIGLAYREDASNFFIYLSILITFALLMNAQMALYASFASADQVQVYGACTLLAMMLFCGFILPPNEIPNYYSWIYWWNPFAWAYRALVVNEFRNPTWDDPDEILQANGFVEYNGAAFPRAWVGYGFAYMVPYWLLCVVLSAIGLSSAHHSTKASVDVSENTASVSEGGGEVKIPFKPVALSFHDICYEVTASTTKKQLKLLKNVNGVFSPGRMCALMVSSIA